MTCLRPVDTVYHWFMRRALIGSRVVARKPRVPETAECAALEGKGSYLGPCELGLLAKRLATASDPVDTALIKKRLTRGFYGV